MPLFYFPRTRNARAILLFLAIGLAAAATDLILAERGRRRDAQPPLRATATQPVAFAPRRAADAFRHKTDRRVLVIGWDGGTFDMVDPLLKLERLPNVRKLMDRGVQATLMSTVIPISTEAWAAAVTGKGPGKSGIVGFFRNLPNTYDIELVDQTRMDGAPLWRIFSAHGLRSITWAIPITFPIESVDGLMVGGMLAPLDSAYAYPPNLLASLRQRGFLPDLGKWRENRELTLELVEQQLQLKRDLLVNILKKDQWTLTLVNFKCLDVLCHRKYVGKTSGDVADLYCKLDAVLGDLIDAAGPQTDVVLMSDHGFATYYRSFSINRFLADKGYLVRVPSALLQPEEQMGGRRLPNRKVSTVEDERRNEHREEIDATDMSRTVAYAGVTEGEYGTIRINLAGREPRGIVKPSERDALLDRIERDLLAVVDPVTKRQAVRRVFRTAKLYPGPHIEELPEIMFEADPALFVRPEYRLAAFRRLPFMIPSHDDRGMFIAAGPSFGRVSARLTGSVLDMAPLVLQLVGLPAYHEMDGRVPTQWLADAKPIARIGEQEDAALKAWEVRFGEGFTDDQRRQGVNDVRDNGYVVGG